MSLLTANSGSVTIGAGAVVHSSNAINLNTSNFSSDPSALLYSDHSQFNFTGTIITFVQDGFSPPPGSTGLFIPLTEWNSYVSRFENIGLVSGSDIVFEGSFDLTGLGRLDSLTINAQRIIDSASNSTVTLSLAYGSVGLFHHMASQHDRPGCDSERFNHSQQHHNAERRRMQVGKGTVLFDNFSTVNLNAQNDLDPHGGGRSTHGQQLRSSGPPAP